MRRLLPRPTLRLRLTLLYGGLFLAAGTVLLVITYELVAHSPPSTVHGQFVVARAPAVRQLPAGLLLGGPGQFARPSPNGGTIDIRAYQGKVKETFRKLTATQQKQLNNVADHARVVLQRQQSSQLDALVTRSGVALGIMAIISIGLGWLVAGRALRPVRTMSARARGISERNLHERLALDGPNDELKELGDTFDELLARLESAFESQRRFVANASHELRTPITLERALVEVALADSGATMEDLRGTCRRVLASSEHQERMIDALLTLARSQRGLESREQLRLDEVAAEALSRIRPDGVRIESELGPAPTLGDAGAGRAARWQPARQRASLQLRQRGMGPSLDRDQRRAPGAARIQQRRGRPRRPGGGADRALPPAQRQPPRWPRRGARPLDRRRGRGRPRREAGGASRERGRPRGRGLVPVPGAGARGVSFFTRCHWRARGTS